MRTTLDIDEDLLSAAKELARHEGATAGQVISRLLRQSLTGVAGTPASAPSSGGGVAGFVPFPARPGVVVTDAQVNRLRDAEGL